MRVPPPKGCDELVFDFYIFSRVAEMAYREAETTYTLQEVLDVFEYFFDSYEAVTGEVHPPIRKEQIAKIIKAMPFYDEVPNASGYADIVPEAYPVLIDKYFQKPFRNCNYRINHFFSGDIRTLRMYEELY